MIQITPIAAMKVTREVCLSVYPKDKAASKLANRYTFNSRCDLIRKTVNDAVVLSKNKADLKKINFKAMADTILGNGRFRKVQAAKLANALKKSVSTLVGAKGWTVPADMIVARLPIDANDSVTKKIQKQVHAALKNKVKFSAQELVTK